MGCKTTKSLKTIDSDRIVNNDGIYKCLYQTSAIVTSCKEFNWKTGNNHWSFTCKIDNKNILFNFSLDNAKELSNNLSKITHELVDYYNNL